MTKEEAKEFVKDIHAAYPNWKLDTPQETTLFWHRQFESVDIDIMNRALDMYVDSDDRTYAPQVGQIRKLVEKLQGRASRCTMIFDRDFNVVRWTPEQGGETFEIPVWWDDTLKCYVDDEGREYIDPSKDYSEKEKASEEKLKVERHNAAVARQMKITEIHNDDKPFDFG